ncbi:DivIVA domain-containing protein [Actinoplanes utahensis]|uniref:Cell wall synthesis protein Wag31 n=1 Tax=Actinoplanes utahensis TaxID=1869 RepID=A0A0A6UFQ9_ACTUT|nr:DivIVA domain-containing protein [Actinoplanes utahensis]KHD74865.1 hypothetical protein MB27_26445 [Actinoplanes utahensis]GIF30748.1 hypothetical protein Aut01nite_37340 [Actinoplanes utahensis]
MSITPADVDGIAFRAPASGARGYHEDEVDAFLEGVAEEMRRLAAENEALALRLQHEDLAGHLERLRREYEQAQARVERLRAELAQARAGTPGSEETGLLRLARRTAEEHLDDARREAADHLRKAATEAGKVVSDAELRASTIVADARHSHAEQIAGLAAKRAAALSRIQELTVTADFHRKAVAAELTHRLRAMDGGAPAKPPGAP